MHGELGRKSKAKRAAYIEEDFGLGMQRVNDGQRKKNHDLQSHSWWGMSTKVLCMGTHSPENIIEFAVHPVVGDGVCVD